MPDENVDHYSSSWMAGSAGDEAATFIDSTDNDDADGVRTRNAAGIGRRCAYMPPGRTERAMGRPRAAARAAAPVHPSRQVWDVRT